CREIILEISVSAAATEDRVFQPLESSQELRYAKCARLRPQGFTMRPCGIAGVSLARRHIGNHPTLRPDSCPRTDHQVSRDTGLSPQPRAVSEGGASRDPHLRYENHLPADPGVVTEVHQIVDLRTRTDYRISHRAPVDRHVCA